MGAGGLLTRLKNDAGRPDRGMFFTLGMGDRAARAGRGGEPL
jgi:hypothetical protein